MKVRCIITVHINMDNPFKVNLFGTLLNYDNITDPPVEMDQPVWTVDEQVMNNSWTSYEQVVNKSLTSHGKVVNKF